MTSVRRLDLVAGILLLQLSLAAAATEHDVIGEVYRDENIVVSAGVPQSSSDVRNFGDVLSLIVEVQYDDNQVSLPQPDAKYFSTSWPESKGIYLKDIQSTQRTATGDLTDVIRHQFDFQVIGCPLATAMCRGERLYEIPEFTFEYDLIDAEGNTVSSKAVRFHPLPPNISIATTLELTEEGELNTFLSYFPNGAYPQPLSGIDSRYSSLGVIAGGLFLLLGGVLMSPFSFFKRKTDVSGTTDRWEPILEQLRAGAFADDAHQLDALRRCLVWYCTDKLGVDPFYWVKHQEEVSGQQQKGTGELVGYRDLFNDILLSPRGQGKQLLDRLSQLIAKGK
jgi:hypothetical protein